VTTDEELPERIAKAQARARELARRLSKTAGEVAVTESEVARVHDQIARAGVSAIAVEAAEHAARARRFAEQEQRAQQRWACWSGDDY
jgi:hypothetical protein